MNELPFETSFVLNATRAVLWQADCDPLHFKYFSSNAREILGIDAAAWCADASLWADSIHEEDRPAILQACRELCERGEDHVLTYRVIHPDGQLRWVRDSIHILPSEGRRRLVGVMEDITEHRQMELIGVQQSKARELFETILSNAVDLMGLVDHQDRIIYVSPSVKRILGYTPQELLGRVGSTLIAADERELALENQARLRHDPSIKLEVVRTFMTKDGRRKRLQLHVLMLGPGSPVQGGLLLGRDMEAELQAQEALSEHEALHLMYQRLAVFGQLAAGLAHEVRNPLASILNAAQLAQRRLKSGQADAEQLEVIVRQAERLKVLMEDVLQHARSSRQSQSLVDPCASMERAVDQALSHFGPQAAKFQVRRSCALGQARVLVTEERLQRLLVNLVLNALQAIGERGGRLWVSANVEGAEAVLRVEDDGPGFAAESLTRLFEPFFTTKPTGSGLGLWIAQSLSQEMGGRLSAEPAQPHGAIFTLRLPLAGAA